MDIGKGFILSLALGACLSTAPLAFGETRDLNWALAYDAQGPSTSDQAATQHLCSMPSRSQQGSACEIWSQRTHRVSDDPQYEAIKYIIGWTQDFDQTLQAFFHDTEFECAHPALALFLGQRLGVPLRKNCGGRWILPFRGGPTTVSVNLEKIYKIQLVRSSPGTDFMGHWGHIMYRVVTCSPLRRETSPDCLKDRRYHFFLSFYMDQKGKKDNIINGVTGVYSTSFQLFPFWDWATRYVSEAGRPLHMYDLKMDSNQIQLFMSLASEALKSYSQHWNHLTQNCAVHAFQLLRASIKEPDLDLIKVATPTQLVQSLYWAQLLEKPELVTVKDVQPDENQ